MLASELFFKDILQHLLVEREVRHQLLELMVLLLQLPQATELGVAETPVLLLPVVERSLTDTELTANFSDLRPGLGLAQCEDDLRFGELRLFHGDRAFDAWYTIAR